MRGRRLWLRAETLVGTVPVYVVKELVDDETGDDLAGCFYPEVPALAVRQVDSVASMKQTLHHELLHICFRGHSGSAREKVLRAKTADGRHDREEDIVSFLEPVQFDLLVRNGWLKYPNPPRVK